MKSIFRTTLVQSLLGHCRGHAAAAITRTLVAFTAIALLAVPSVAAAQQPLVTRQSAYIARFASAMDESDAPVLLRQPVTLRLRNVTLERALQEITSRAGVSLAYSRAVVP
ncbi:MAG TPA: hypothetical protein VHE82_13755, partial [Gemmatimonadaceae bacterium]|nr:hypothetical protein [Gemmatimonadaceae bacterium]